MPNFNLNSATQAAIGSDNFATFEQFLNSNPRVADISHLVPYILDRARQFPDKSSVYVEMIKAFIQICPIINVNHTFNYHPSIESNNIRFTPLMYAARFDLDHIVTFLLSQPSINIMAQLPTEQTAIELATKNTESWKLLRQAYIQKFSQEAAITDSGSLETLLKKYQAANIQPQEVADSIKQEVKTQASINALILSLSHKTALDTFLNVQGNQWIGGPSIKATLLAHLREQKIQLIGHHGTIDQLSDEQMKNRFKANA